MGSQLLTFISLGFPFGCITLLLSAPFWTGLYHYNLWVMQQDFFLTAQARMRQIIWLHIITDELERKCLETTCDVKVTYYAGTHVMTDHDARCIYWHNCVCATYGFVPTIHRYILRVFTHPYKQKILLVPLTSMSNIRSFPSTGFDNDFLLPAGSRSLMHAMPCHAMYCTTKGILSRLISSIKHSTVLQKLQFV